MGRQLAREAPADADIIVPIPDSGVPAAIGYSQESGLPFEYGIIRNHYVGRTFIEPEQRIRQLGVKLKHSANEFQVKGKRIVLIDDSVVRGTTSVKIVQMMRDAGAKRSAYAHFQSADHPSRFLRHRHARPGQAARRQSHPGGDARNSSAPIASPSSRSTASTRPWAMKAATTPIRSSPTIASPANIRPGSETAKARRSRSSSPSSPRWVDGTTPQGPHRAHHRRLARHRPRRGGEIRARRRACAAARAQPQGARTGRRRDQGRRRQGLHHSRSSSPTANPSMRSDPRSMSASASSTCWSAMPRSSDGCLPSPIFPPSIGTGSWPSTSPPIGG